LPCEEVSAALILQIVVLWEVNTAQQISWH